MASGVARAGRSIYLGRDLGGTVREEEVLCFWSSVFASILDPRAFLQSIEKKSSLQIRKRILLLDNAEIGKK